MSLEIKIIKGDKVIKLLKKNEFNQRWNDLSKSQKKISLFQEISFLLPWYNHYKSKYNPILVLGYFKSEIVGIIPLALSFKNNELKNAGTYQAEYKAWICDPNYSHEFLVQAFIIIKNNFNFNKNWFWGWLPPGTRIDWLNDNRLEKNGVFASTTTEKSPVLDLSNLDIIQKLKKSRSLRTKTNRLKRKGNLRIERITSKEKAQIVLNVLEDQCDFRQMATYQYMPFRDDPIRKKFLVNKIENLKNNHFTVLFIDEKPIAFNYGDCNNDTVFLGLVSYDPLEGKNSPGTIFMIMLIELLADEGYKYFDLTPGGDVYKKKFQNSEQEVLTLKFFFNKNDKLISGAKTQLKNKTKKLLSKLSINPTSLAQHFNKPLNLFKEVSKFKPKKDLKHLFIKQEEIKFYNISINNLNIEDLEKPSSIQINNYSDLFYLEESHEFQKENIFSEALKKFEKESKLFTLNEGDSLIDFLWVTKKTSSYKEPYFNLNLKFFENSVLIHDALKNEYHTNPTLLLNSLQKIKEKSKESGVENIIIKIKGKNIPSEKFITDLKFKKYLEIQNQRVLYFFHRKKEIYY